MPEISILLTPAEKNIHRVQKAANNQEKPKYDRGEMREIDA